MIVLETHPQLSDLNHFIDKVPVFPITASQLAAFAKRNKFSQEVVDFYRQFRATAVFSNKEDLSAQTEVLEFLQTEQQPGEDAVHGAED